MASNRAYAGNQTPAKMNRLIAKFNAGHYQELENDARELLVQYPNSGFVTKVLGAALQLQGKDALSELQQACKLLPNDAEVHNNLGVALRERRQFDSALQSYQRALAIQPAYAEAYNNRGIAQNELGKKLDAVASFRQALKLNPRYAEAYNNLGNVLQECGQIDDAISNYRKALGLRPQYAEAHNNLGKALHNLDQFDEAMASYRLALEIKTDYVDAHSNLALLLREVGQLDAAVASSRRALASKPNCAFSHNNMGIALHELGQIDAAIASFRKALEIDPNFAEAHGNLGSSLMELCQIDEAAACYQRALQIKPDFAAAHVGLGQLLRMQGRIADAIAHCQSALDLDQNLVGALLFSAELFIDHGKFEEAEAALRKVISIKPASPQAWAAIARTRKMTDDDTDWLTATKRIVTQNLPSRREVYLRYALGKYFDDTKDFELAFFNYWRANEIAKEFANKYRPERHVHDVDLAMQTYDRAWLDKVRVNGNPSARPVLIIGMPRSGTSLAEQIIASHPAAFGAGELVYWEAAAARQDMSAMSGECSETFQKLAGDYLSALNEFSTDALKVIDKMPRNFMHLGLIAASFPNARIIHMQRNPIDTCLSIYFQHFNVTHDYSNDMEDIAHYFTQYDRMMKHWRHVLPEGAILDVPYEGLVDDPEGWSRKMLAFIDLPWDARCLNFHQHLRTVRTTSNWQVRQKISKTSVERWRNYEKFVKPLLRLLEPDLS